MAADLNLSVFINQAGNRLSGKQNAVDRNALFTLLRNNRRRPGSAETPGNRHSEYPTTRTGPHGDA
jgi:hypothetical protein